MYTLLLTLHNVTRWLVVLFALIVIVRAFSGWFGKKSWNSADNRAGLIYTIVLDVQLLLGIILYIYPGIYTHMMLSDPGAAMGNPLVRFYAVEHATVMLLAVVLAHIARSVSRHTAEALGKHRKAAIWFTISFVAILAAIPWPFMENTGRPWLRLFGLVF
ncbi:MAG TPA: hypothetical protein VLH85_05045 [Levilinea sp.]|nr:hypothetical protein [Levilinea sp.]